MQIVCLCEVEFSLVVVWQVFWQWDIVVMNVDQMVDLNVYCFLQLVNFVVVFFCQCYVILLVNVFVVVEFNGFKCCWVIF